MRGITRAATVGLAAMAVAGCWPVPGSTPENTYDNPFEATVTAANVAGLAPAWSYTAPSALHAPAVSAGGLHVVDDACTLTTLAPGTGGVRWNAALEVDAGVTCATAAGHMTPVAGSPFVTGPNGGDVVSAGAGGEAGAPGSFDTWRTTTFDIQTGALRSADPAGILVATRPGKSASARQHAVGPGISAQALTVREGATSHEIDLTLVATGSVATPPPVTAASTMLLHAGSGPLSTVPGAPGTGHGLRAYSYTADVDGCAPVTGPGGGTFTVDCPLWANALDGTPVSAPPVVGAGGTAYVATQGHVYAVGSDGVTLWSDDLGGGRPALAHGVLYVPSGTGVRAYDAGGCGAATCAPLWAADLGGVTATGVSVGGDVLYATAGATAQAFAAGGCGSATCAPLWSYALGATATGSPVISGGRLYVTSGAEVTAFTLG
jgi:hypothetical protein